jgi:hypothetical protein
MVDFDTDLDDLRSCSGDLAEAADAAERALRAVRGFDIPTGPIMPGLFGGPGNATVDNIFGMTLGMPHVANAYSAHLASIEKLLQDLQESTVDASRSFAAVADTYQQAEDDSTSQLNNAAAGLDRS